jgi:hypothetical protein
MTLVPRADFKDPGVRALDDRRVFELYPGHEAHGLTDFEARELNYDPEKHSLVINGAAARLNIRWRFAHPSAVTVNGRKPDKLTATADGTSVEFKHQGKTTLTWR